MRPGQSMKPQQRGLEGHGAHPLAEDAGKRGGDLPWPPALRNCWYVQHRPVRITIWFPRLSEVRTGQALGEDLQQGATQKN